VNSSFIILNGPPLPMDLGGLCGSWAVDPGQGAGVLPANT